MGEPVGFGGEGFVETVVKVLVVREDDVAADIVQLIASGLVLGLLGVEVEMETYEAFWGCVC